jgi:hypothetical protein
MKYEFNLVGVFKDDKAVFDIYESYKDDLAGLVNGL